MVVYHQNIAALFILLYSHCSGTGIIFLDVWDFWLIPALEKYRKYIKAFVRKAKSKTTS